MQPAAASQKARQGTPHQQAQEEDGKGSAGDGKAGRASKHKKTGPPGTAGQLTRQSIGKRWRDKASVVS